MVDDLSPGGNFDLERDLPFEKDVKRVIPVPLAEQEVPRKEMIHRGDLRQLVQLLGRKTGEPGDVLES